MRFIVYISVVQLRARGPHPADGIYAARGTIVQAAATFLFEERYDFGTKKELRRSIPIEDLFFF